MSTKAYAALLAIVALQRCVELWLTHARLRALPPEERTRSADSPWTWRAMVALHVGLVVLPAFEVFVLRRSAPNWLGRSAPPWLAGSAVAAFLLAQILRYWAISSAGSAWNARAVVATTTAVSDRGPYRFVRHPNYLAVLIEFSAVPLAGGAWISWVVLNALHAPVLRARIRGEERLLASLPEWRARMSGKGLFWPRAQRS